MFRLYGFLWMETFIQWVGKCMFVYIKILKPPDHFYGYSNETLHKILKPRDNFWLNLIFLESISVLTPSEKQWDIKNHF